MEYYGRPLPEPLPGSNVLTSYELDFYVRHYEQKGFTPAINWYRNISRNWKAGLDMDQTIRVPSLMVSAANDDVLRRAWPWAWRPMCQISTGTFADCWHWTRRKSQRNSTDWFFHGWNDARLSLTVQAVGPA